MDGTILIADDDRTIRTVLTQALTRAGCKVHATSSLMTLMRWVEEGKGDLVISDVIMPDGNGLDALPRIARLRPGLPVIVISAQNTIMTAIQAAEAEAFDYLPKPFDLPDLMKRSAKALDQKRRMPQAAGSPRETGDDLPLVGRTPAMQALYRLVARVMNTDLPVLISGESGTGKSLIARAIHDFSDRRTLPFVVAQASDLQGIDGPSALLAKARGGSITFDEVADFDEDTQARVVRMLDLLGDNAPRVMATSQTDLSARMEAGLFRQDLYYRLGGVALHSAAGRAFRGPWRARSWCRPTSVTRCSRPPSRLFLARQCAATGKHHPPPSGHLDRIRDHQTRGRAGSRPPARHRAPRRDRRWRKTVGLGCPPPETLL
jgi:two-component system, NtrC family, nitrogen regulation response regulator GlnG